MASKSDFAQKLLHDLRLRKERMGASQGSTSSSTRNATTRDAYRNPGSVQRGSGQTKSLESIGGSKTMNHQLISNRRSDQALSINESSQQLVSYRGGQHQRSESFGDLSMAFNYAFKNGGNTKTMIDFLQQIGRRSLNVENTRNGTMTSLVQHRPSNGGGTGVPVLTTIQIKEISKGVQNLYEIIRSSSNGKKVDKYSMEVGKELLKGAKGLEESLRMLVNLQEASEMMVSPQRKSRVTLLEVDDDNEEDRSKVVDRNQVPLPRFSFDKPSKKSSVALTDGSSKLSTHRRSASCGAESVRSVSTAKDTSTPSRKGRISNVIAKLMGLEDVPGKPDSYSKPDELKNVQELTINTVYKTSRPVNDGVVSLNDRKSQQIHDTNTDGVLRMKQNNNSRLDRVPEKQERQTNGNTKEKMQQKRRSAESAVSLRVDKKKTIRKEKSNEIKLVSRNSQILGQEKRTQKSKQESQKIKQVKHPVLPLKEPKPQPIQTFEPIPKAKESIPKKQEFERIERYMQPQVMKEKPVTRNKVDSIAICRTESPRTRDEVLKIKDRTLNNLTTPSKHKLSILKEAIKRDVSLLLKPEETNNKQSNSMKSESTIQIKDIVPVCENKTQSDPDQLNSEIIVAEKNVYTDEHGETYKFVRKHESILLKPEEVNNERWSSMKPFKSHDIVPVCENKIQSDPRLTSEIIVSGPSDVIIKAANVVENKPTDNVVENKSKRTFYSNKRVVLNEHEKQLKEILIKDQLFLSTAQALFKLNIPIGFLHADDHNHHRDETKLKLDCGYEILKRKARNQELSLHPYVKPSIGATAIRFLDELVKQLYKDLESLRIYGRNAHNEFDEADYLHYMLERDIYNTNPNINSFWDFGWNITTFTFLEKDEFVNDVEQYVLRTLVDEIVNDLLSMSLPFWPV